MHRKTLDIGQLPSWAKLNNIEFSGIAISNIPGKGYGLIVTAERSEDDAILMTVPKDLILSCENVWVLAKADQDLREVLEAVGDYGRVLYLAAPFAVCASLMYARQREEPL